MAGGGVAAIETVLALQALAGDRVPHRAARSGRGFHRARTVRARTLIDGADTPRVALDELGVDAPPRRTGRGGDGGRRGGERWRGDGQARRPQAAPRRHPARRAAASRSPPMVGGSGHRSARSFAVGARPVEAVPGATVFRGPVSAGAVECALRCERVVLDRARRRVDVAALRARPAVRAREPDDRHARAAPARRLRPSRVRGGRATASASFIGETVPRSCHRRRPRHPRRPADPRRRRHRPPPALRTPHRGAARAPHGFIPVDAHARVERGASSPPAMRPPSRSSRAASPPSRPTPRPRRSPPRPARRSRRGRSPGSCARSCSRSTVRWSSAATSTPARTNSPAAT